MTADERRRLRTTFGEDAELYDRCRPGYPAQLFSDIAASVGIDNRSSLLEIGCGTGQATVPLAQTGCSVTAVELGESLAAIARRRLAGFPHAQVVVAAFEEYLLPPDPFDLVLFATAFHWVDPGVRVAKSVDALRPGGWIAIVSTHHVAGGTEPFFADVQRCYERFDRDTPPGLRLPRAGDVPQDSAELDDSERFGPVRFHRYAWEQAYSTGAYLDLLSTYSGHRALPEAARDGLLDCIAELIDGRYDGRITKAYLTQLALARRRG